MSDTTDVKVSVLCIAYNQESYIRDALDSFLAQETSFPFEVLVSDDASTDATPQILAEYAERHPDVFRIFAHTENLYSQGRSNIREYLLPNARGNYLALCEGDDYWIDPHKLQRQYDYLEAHPNVNLCVTASVNVRAESKQVCGEVAPYEEDRLVPTEDVLTSVHLAGTNTFFMRASSYRAYWDSAIYRSKAHPDMRYLYYFALTGDIYYMSARMSAYRVLAKGSINSRLIAQGDDARRQRDLLERRLDLIRVADDFSEGRWHDVLEEAKVTMTYAYHYSMADIATLKADYPTRWQAEPPRRRAIALLKHYAPHLYQLAVKAWRKL